MNGYVAPATDWGPEAERQWWLAAESCCLLARAYVREGVRVAIDAYRPPVPGDQWDDLLAGVDVHHVALLPSLAVCTARNNRRNGDARLSDEALARNYSNFQWCLERNPVALILDNESISVDDSAHAIDAHLTTLGVTL